MDSFALCKSISLARSGMLTCAARQRSVYMCCCCSSGYDSTRAILSAPGCARAPRPASQVSRQRVLFCLVGFFGKLAGSSFGGSALVVGARSLKGTGGPIVCQRDPELTPSRQRGGGVRSRDGPSSGSYGGALGELAVLLARRSLADTSRSRARRQRWRPRGTFAAIVVRGSREQRVRPCRDYLCSCLGGSQDLREARSAGPLRKNSLSLRVRSAQRIRCARSPLAWHIRSLARPVSSRGKPTSSLAVQSGNGVRRCSHSARMCPARAVHERAAYLRQTRQSGAPEAHARAKKRRLTCRGAFLCSGAAGGCRRRRCHWMQPRILPSAARSPLLCGALQTAALTCAAALACAAQLCPALTQLTSALLL